MAGTFRDCKSNNESLSTLEDRGREIENDLRKTMLKSREMSGQETS